MPAVPLKIVNRDEFFTSKFQVHFGTKGMSTSFRVESGNLATLQAYLNSITPLGVTGTISGIDGGQDRWIDVEVPGLTANMVGVLNEIFFDSWELLTNDATDTIFSDPVIVGGNAPILNYNDKVVLARLARDGGSIADAVISCNADIGNGLTAPTGGNGGNAQNQFQAPTSGAALQLALEIQKGQTEYESPARVLRHTSYCSPTATYNALIAHEEFIYTLGELLTEISTGWTYNCPQRLLSKIASITPQVAPAEEAPYYTWGWKKKFSREVLLPSFIVEVNVEYALGLWSNLRYQTF